MIDIIYEDNHLLVVQKASNVPVQADESKDEDLLNILKKYLKKKYNKPGNVYLGLVHRLDRPVGGLMVFAKTSKAASRLSDQVRTHRLEKIYYAVLEGRLEPKTGVLKDKLLKDCKANITTVDKNGKEAELSYELISYQNNLSLVKIYLKTGRSHQIRVQFSSRGFPLYGDQKYNKDTKKDQIALYATELYFYHPITNEKIGFKIALPNRFPFNLFK